jgi:hypothetical protein
MYKNGMRGEVQTSWVFWVGVIILSMTVFFTYKRISLNQKFAPVIEFANKLRFTALTNYAVNGRFSPDAIDTDVPCYLYQHIELISVLPTKDDQSIKIKLVLSPKVFGMAFSGRMYTYTMLGQSVNGVTAWVVDKTDDNTLCPADRLCSNDRLKRIYQ